MRVTCKHCGGAHPDFECRKKSTEPKNMPVANGVVPVARVEPTDSAVRAKQAVGTNSKKGRVFAAPLGLASPANASDAKTANTKDAPKFDRKAWMREYQRNYMRNVYRPKLKAFKSNPNTPERNDE